MLNAFRQKGLTSAVYGVLIVATVVVFVINFRPGAQGKTGSIKQECVAEIRGRCIEPKEYFAELMLVAPGRLVEGSQARALGVRRAVLDGLVERTLLVQDAERLGLAVSEDELDNELVKGRAHVSLPVDRGRSLGYSLRLGDDMVRILPVLTPDTKAFDYKVYDRTVRQYTNRSPTEFKNMQRSEILAARMRDLVRERVRVGDEEAFAVYQREKASATIRFVALHRNWFAAHVLDLSPPAVEAWAGQHAEEVGRVFESRKSQFLPECRRARHILIKVPETAGADEKASARQKIEGVLERVKAGADFARVARETSDDGSASEGGDLGCFQHGRMVKPFEDAAFALKVGEVSPIVETQFGYHVIKLEGIYSGPQAEAEGRRETARSLMITEEAEALAAETAKKILAAIKGGKRLDDEVLADSLPGQRATKTKKPKAADGKRKGADAEEASTADQDNTEPPKVEISPPFSAAADPIPGVVAGQNAAQIAFGLAKDGDAPDDLIKLEDGYAVMQLKEKSVATREQYEKDRDTFVAAMLAAKQADALNGYLARLRDGAKSEIKLNEAYAKADEKDKRAEGEEE
jgi:peptidyl-prolyl cis-trans isomerase D